MIQPRRGLLDRVAVLLALVSVAQGLYEDQAGSFDWHQQFVGPISSASLHGSKPRAYVGTSQNVVGSLNLRDGSIAWRKLLEDPTDSVVLLDRQSLLLSVSRGGSRVRAWDQGEGGFRWEAAFETNVANAAHSISVGYVEDVEDEAQLAVATPSWLKVLNCRTGATVSSHPLPFQGTNRIHAHHSQHEIVAFGYAAGSQDLLIASLGSDESSPMAEKTMHSPAALSAVSAAGPAGFAALSADLGSLCTYGAGAAEVACFAIADLAPSLAGSSSLQLIPTATGFVLSSGDRGAALLSLPPSPAPPALLQLYGSASLVSSPVTSTHGEVLALLEEAAAGAVQVRVVSTATGEEVSSDTAPSPRSQLRGADDATIRLKAAYLGTYRKKDKSDGFRSLLVWEDDHVSLLQQGTSVWSRSEALGSIQSSMFVDLPVPSGAAAAAAAATGGAQSCSAKGGGSCPAPQGSGFDWQHFIRTQLLNVKVQFKTNTPDEADELMKLRAQVSDRTAPFRDVNGFRKLIVSLTQSGSLVAVHNGDGHVVWSRHYPQTHGVPDQLLPWRMYHDLQHAPQLLALHSGQGGGKGTAFASVVDAHSGREIQRLPLEPVVKVLPVHQHLVDGQAEQSLYVLVGALSEQGRPSVRLLPDNAQARSWFASNWRSLYFWLHYSDSNTLTGYGFDRAGAEGMASEGVASALQVWQLAPPEPILGVTSRDLKQAVQSSVKVLGDRSIKYRYLNPNTLLVALGSSSATPASAVSVSTSPQRDDEALPSVTLMLLDSTTGRVMHSQVQMGAMGPLRLLLTENVALAEFWDSVARRMTIVSMEIFDATPREFSVLDYLFNPNSTKPISSYDSSPLEVESQAFWTRTPSKLLSVTTTQQGITSKQVLMATITDQLYAMDLRFLDPRRPKHQKLTTQEQEERLIPYQEYLPIVPNQMASYDKQILGLRNIAIEPSRLESTCLVFASGVDLFYTRLAPNRKYDSLEDDFAYALLVVALLGLAAGAIIMSRITKKSMLSQKWT